MKLTNEERVLLTEIVNNKMSVGAFSGMIFNAQLANKDMKVDELIQKALSIRLTMKDLCMATNDSPVPAIPIHKGV